MAKLKSSFKDYLDRVGYLEEIRLGDEASQRSVTDEDNRRLAAVLDQRSKINKYVVLAILVSLGLLFAVAAFILMNHRNDLTFVSGVFGALLLSNYGLIRWLRQLWWEANIMDASLYVLQKMSPDQAAAFINRLYWDFLQTPKASRGSGFTADQSQ
jgi:hypothetical protein